MAKQETPECGPNVHLEAGLFFIFSSGNQMVQYPIEDTWLLHFELVTLADYRWFVLLLYNL